MEGSSSTTNEGSSQQLTSSDAESVFQDIEQQSDMLDETIKRQTNIMGFTPYYNEKTKITMFVSADGRSCYYTTDPSDTTFSP